MKQTGLLFTGSMVRAILEGRKTQTRRIVKLDDHGLIDKAEFDDINLWYFFTSDNYVVTAMPCPYGGVGDRLWVRETWRETGSAQLIDGSIPKTGNLDQVVYAADHPWDGPFRPSRFMPRWASRITLEITDIQAQRVQEISEKDAEAEGVEKMHIDDLGQTWKTYQRGFESLWDSLNAKRGYGWESNPWVWAITFKPIKEAK